MNNQKQEIAAPGGQDYSTRERLIDATIESVYQHGYSDTTIAKISDLAEMSIGVVHHHFSSKEELLEMAMRRVLGVIHGKLTAGCAEAESPRAKLWAVIQSVLGDEQSEDKMALVWLAFWVQAEHNDNLRRIRDIYNRRLTVNVRTYLRRMLVEIGAKDIESREYSGSLMLISLMHGVWVSHVIKEDPTRDMAHGRLLVWECLEMLLSRAQEPLAPEEGTVATSAALLSDVSFEVTSADVGKLDDWREHVSDGTPVYIPHFRAATEKLPDRVRQASKLGEVGYAPVAHIAARNVRNAAELERIVAGMSAMGVRDFLLLGGGEKRPIGEYETAMQLLKSGVLQRYGAVRVGFAGHPETHPDQPRDVMRRALTEKIAAAKEANLDCYIVTQFCFAARPFFDFLDWTREGRFGVPVRLGVAGRVNAAKLVKFAATCGIGRSLSFLRRQFGKTMHLVNYSPDGLLAELSAGIAVRGYDFPIGVHFYPFGAMAETLALITAAGVESGNAELSTHTQRGEPTHVH